MANTVGQAYGLTVLSPIRGDLVNGVSRARLLRTQLAALPNGPDSPFARLPMMHFARWVVIDELPVEGFPAKDDQLANAWLLFVCEFDGALDPMLQLLATAAGEAVDAICAHCVGYPGADSLRAFATWFHKCQIETTFLFSSYPDDTVADVQRALVVQRAFVAWLAEHLPVLHGPVGAAEAAALQAAFRTFWRGANAAPLPPRGAP